MMFTKAAIPNFDILRPTFYPFRNLLMLTSGFEISTLLCREKAAADVVLHCFLRPYYVHSSLHLILSLTEFVNLKDLHPTISPHFHNFNNIKHLNLPVAWFPTEIVNARFPI